MRTPDRHCFDLLSKLIVRRARLNNLANLPHTLRKRETCAIDSSTGNLYHAREKLSPCLGAFPTSNQENIPAIFRYRFRLSACSSAIRNPSATTILRRFGEAQIDA
jgi:hypothetical protein